MIFNNNRVKAYLIEPKNMVQEIIAKITYLLSMIKDYASNIKEFLYEKKNSFKEWTKPKYDNFKIIVKEKVQYYSDKRKLLYDNISNKIKKKQVKA